MKWEEKETTREEQTSWCPLDWIHDRQTDQERQAAMEKNTTDFLIIGFVLG